MTGARLAIPSDYERLRRRDEHKRLLEEAAAPHEHVLLATALGVMARVRLVDREPEEPERVRRQVDVHRDPAPQVAEVFAQKPHLPAVVELVEESASASATSVRGSTGCSASTAAARSGGPK